MRHAFILLTTTLLLSSCKFEMGNGKEEETDENTGLEVRSEGGLRFGDAYLTIDESEARSSEIPLGSKMTIHVEGIRGLILEDEKHNLNAGFLVKDKDDNVVVQYMGEFKDDQYNQLKFFVPPDHKFKVGETYRITARIEDNNGDGSASSNLTFTIAAPIENEYVNVTEKGISAEHVIIMHNKGVYTGNEAFPGDRLDVMVFADKDTAFHNFEYRFDMLSPEGDVIDSYESQGNLEKPKGSMNLYITVGSNWAAISKEVIWRTTIKDTQSGNAIQIEYPFTVLDA